MTTNENSQLHVLPKEYPTNVYYQNDEEWSGTIISHRVAHHDFWGEIDEVKARNHEKTIM